MRRITLLTIIALQLTWNILCDDKSPTSTSWQLSQIDLTGQWKFKLDNKAKQGIGLKEGWFKPDYDDNKWAKIRVGKSWESQGYNYNGIAWYRRKVYIPEAWKANTLYFTLGKPDDKGTVYINGEKVFETKKFGSHIVFCLRGTPLKYGTENTIAIRVPDWYKNGGLHGKKFGINTLSPFHPAPTKEIMEIKLSIDNKLKQGITRSGWVDGWRDTGTSDTRPNIFIAQKAFHGKNALKMEICHPNTAEFIDYKLEAYENGSVWSQKECDYISFYYKAVGTQGKMRFLLNKGNLRWGKKVLSYFTSFTVHPGDWQKVILPFSAFKTGRHGKYSILHDTTDLNTISIGYGNNQLQSKGFVLFADFKVGHFDLGNEAQPIKLDGLWRFKRDNQTKEGVGLEKGWFSPDFNDSSWTAIFPKRSWESQGFNYDGVAWYRQKVFIPANWQGYELKVNLGKPDDRGEVFFNGKEVYKIKKFGKPFEFILKPTMIQYGKLNTLAIRVVDWYKGGGLIGSPFQIKPVLTSIKIKALGDTTAVAPNHYKMPPKAGQTQQLIMDFFPKVSGYDDLVLDYSIEECFKRTIKTGNAVIKRTGSKLLATITLNSSESRRLFYGEWFNVSGIMRSKKHGPIMAFSLTDNKLNYEARDQFELPELPETIEQTPIGKLKLIDVIKCGNNPEEDPHPYKEGGIRASWVGTKAYSTWKDGIKIREFKGKKYREANNNEFFGYRVGRGKLKPRGAYLLRILYPEDKTRYFAIDIKTGRNYQGTGFRTGVSEDDPFDNYPISHQYEWYDHILILDDLTYGYQGARKTSTENGFWIFFHDNGRCYTSQYASGPAAAEIRLYEISDIEKTYPVIRYPEGAPKRVLMMDWEREPEANPVDVARYARLMGMNAISPVFQKWAFMAYFKSKLKWDVPKPGAWNKLQTGKDNDDEVYDEWLKATKKVGINFIPRVEYGGSQSLPHEAYAKDRNNKNAKVGRYASWGANLLHPATWNEFETIIDELITSKINDYPQLKGLLWRMRNERVCLSTGPRDIAMYKQETGSNDLKGYNFWWHRKRLEFHKKLRDKLRSIRPDLKLYYFNWDEDGWNLGAKNNDINTPTDWSNLYNVNKAHLHYLKKKQIQKQFSNTDYVTMLTSFKREHKNVLMDLYRNVDGIVFFAPIHWRYLSDNSEYVNYFQTGDGMAMCNLYSYEEKGRWNVHGDNYETSEMGPGGPSFACTYEIMTCFHGDPNVITETPYTYGVGFASAFRRFAKAFLALPAIRGTELNDIKPANSNVKVRKYETDNGTYLGVIHKGYKPATLTVSIPGKWNASTKVIDLVTGTIIPFTIKESTLSVTINSDAMQLNSLLLQ